METFSPNNKILQSNRRANNNYTGKEILHKIPQEGWKITPKFKH